MAKNYAEVKNRRESAGFTKLPYVVQDSANFQKLSGSAVKLLLELIRQHRPHNNGRLIIGRSYLRKRGWRSPLTIHRAALELEYYGLIIKCQQGGKNRFTRYALGWLQIGWADDAAINERFVMTQHVPSMYKTERELYKRPGPKKAKKRAKLIAIDGDLKG